MIEKFNENKSDVLIMIVGTSPMPNLISACTRVKENAVIYALHTKETEIIAENLKNLIEEKCDEVDYDIELNTMAIKGDHEDPNNVYLQLVRIFKEVKKEISNDEVIELNYTGGNKVIASMAYSLFRKIFKDKNALLTYLDGEKSSINIDFINGKNLGRFPYNKMNETLEISINDIIKVHSFEKSNFISESFYEFKNIYEKIDVYDVFYNALIRNLDNKDKFIDLLKPLTKGNVNDKIEGFNKKIIESTIKLGSYNSVEEIFQKYVTINKKLNSTGRKEILRELNGLWFEKALFYKLGNRIGKDIDDVVCSLKRVDLANENEPKPEFEVDLIVLKNHKLFCISVTTMIEYDKAKFKLYEIKLRSSLLAGTEAGIAYINFCENSDEFIKVYKSIWDDDISNTLICAWDRLYNVEERLLAWINGGKDYEN